jgi:hypothetical protein
MPIWGEAPVSQPMSWLDKTDSGSNYRRKCICFYKLDREVGATPQTRREAHAAHEPQQREEQAEQGIAHICIVAQGFVYKPRD